LNVSAIQKLVLLAELVRKVAQDRQEYRKYQLLLNHKFEILVV